MAVDGNDCVAGHREAEGQQQRWQQRQLELGRPAMAATTLGASGSAREGVESGSAREGGEGRSGARLWRSKSATGGRARGQQCTAMVESSSRMAATQGARVAP